MNVRLSEDELWMLYDKVAAEAVSRELASTQAMADCGQAPWIGLKAKLRDALREAVKQ